MKHQDRTSNLLKNQVVLFGTEFSGTTAKGQFDVRAACGLHTPRVSGLSHSDGRGASEANPKHLGYALQPGQGSHGPGAGHPGCSKADTSEFRTPSITGRSCGKAQSRARRPSPRILAWKEGCVIDRIPFSRTLGRERNCQLRIGAFPTTRTGSHHRYHLCRSSHSSDSKR